MYECRKRLFIHFAQSREVRFSPFFTTFPDSFFLTFGQLFVFLSSTNSSPTHFQLILFQLILFFSLLLKYFKTENFFIWVLPKVSRFRKLFFGCKDIKLSQHPNNKPTFFREFYTKKMFFPSPLPLFVFYPLILGVHERVFSGTRSKTFFTALEKVLEGVVKNGIWKRKSKNIL